MFSCTEESPLISEVDLTVVWAYLYAGESVTNIKLTTTIPLDSDSSDAPSINNATVTLIRDGIQYDCISSAGDSGYYHYPDTNLSIESGDIFGIEIDIEGEFISAETSVPNKPLNVTMSADTMEIPDFSDQTALREWRKSGGAFEDVQISWDNEDNSWYYVTLENIEENPLEINTWFKEKQQDFVFPPINDSIYNIKLPYITHLGTHRVTIYKVNQEYIDLYESREQDSRDLNEPLTNIENGLGVFTAFNSSSVFLEVF
ncbi:DUF4249 family protein [bacterium]|nr:DUF4249 family protein [bacterium]